MGTPTATPPRGSGRTACKQQGESKQGNSQGKQEELRTRLSLVKKTRQSMHPTNMHTRTGETHQGRTKAQARQKARRIRKPRQRSRPGQTVEGGGKTFRGSQEAVKSRRTHAEAHEAGRSKQMERRMRKNDDNHHTQESMRAKRTRVLLAHFLFFPAPRGQTPRALTSDAREGGCAGRNLTH